MLVITAPVAFNNNTKEWYQTYWGDNLIFFDFGNLEITFIVYNADVLLDVSESCNEFKQKIVTFLRGTQIVEME